MDINDFCRLLFHRADEEGFSQYEVYYVEGEHFQVQVLNGEIDKYAVNTYCGLSFRVKQEKLISYVSTTILDESSIDQLIDDIKNNFKVLESADEQFIFEGESFYPDVNTFNPELAKVTPLQKIELARQLEREALNYDKKIVRVHTAAVSSGEGSVFIKNNKGLSLFKKENYIFAYVIPIASENGTMNSAIAYICTRDTNEIDPVKMARTASAEAIEQLGASSVPTGNYKTVIRSDAMCDLLDTFWSVFSADNVQKGLSLLGGKAGEKIGADNLTIIDDPLHKSALGTYPFDDEGIAARSKNLIENGILKNYLYNLKTAAKDGVSSTGNGTKASYASPVSVSPSNLFIQPGNLSYEELIAKMGEGLIITELTGLHSGANASTGEFSLGAKGYYVKNGKIAYAVNQLTASGNFYQLLKDVLDMDCNLLWGLPDDGVCGSPSVLFKALSFAGGK